MGKQKKNIIASTINVAHYLFSFAPPLKIKVLNLI